MSLQDNDCIGLSAGNGRLDSMGYKIIRALLLFFFFHILGLHVEGEENIPEKGAVLVVPNHKSYWDPPLAGAAFRKRRICFMAKSELFRNPLFGALIRYLGAFPVKRDSADMSAVRRSLGVIREGKALCIFPEGGIYRKKGLGRFHPGMAFLAVLTGTPVIPVAIAGSRSLPWKKEPLAVLIGRPIPVKKEKPNDKNTAALDDLVKERIEKMLDSWEKKSGTDSRRH